MRRSDAKRVARLRTGESANETTLSAGDLKLETLRQLRILDERVEGAGYPPLLDADERQIVDSGLALGRIDCAALAVALGVHRTTVWRKVGRLLAAASALHRRGATLLGEASPQTWQVLKAMFKTYAWAGVGEQPEGALEIDAFNKLAAMYRAGAAAHRQRYPSYPTGLQLEQRGKKAVITGPGPLEPHFRDAIRVGKAERIYDLPRCHFCGKFISRRATGRPPKYCSERCRSRYRRHP